MLVKITKCLRCNKVLKDCVCVGRQTDGKFINPVVQFTREQLIALIDERIELKK